MSTHCPDHTPFRWSVDTAFEGGGTLAVITANDGMGVLELGLVPADPAFGRMRELAQSLCDAHNGDLGGTAGIAAGGSVPEGFARDLSSEPWRLLVLPAAGGGPAVRIGTVSSGFVAIIGTPAIVASEATVAAASDLVVFHNSLLAAKA